MTNKENGVLPCRVAFEEWFSTRLKPLSLEVSDDGMFYKNVRAQVSWEAWQAAWSTYAEQKAEV